ncbi:MAG: flagellar biosynthesis protein FlhA [Alphaproteobacteria bacterium]|nr:MAG: flagellar biosynthesis protein FlhA [Alphaproteobacteria bacterium]
MAVVPASARERAQGLAKQALAPLRRGEVGLAAGVILILLVLLFPLPTWLLDIGLAISISISIIVLLVTLFITRPLDFNSFPTVLLITTLLRLGLNIASTRLILANGHMGTDAAGHVIQAFGGLLMQGSFIIGIIIFLILVLVNFIVITKGSTRIAEVAARFSLDAMPGKQMAIDADLSSGLITESEAKLRRKELEEESQFFGSMDGAAKFVRGDAVAGLIITAINIIAGLLIGTLEHGISIGQAATNYTVLTVGDGLVSQIPALIISVAAGLIVTKSGTTGSTDKALFRQLGGYPTALGMSSGLMAIMAIMPGIPFIPFMGLAGLLGGAAYLLKKQAEEVEQRKEDDAAASGPAPVAEEPISAALQIDQVRLELGYGLLALINSPKSQRLTDQIKALRRQLAVELGFVMPAVRIQDNLQLPANTYVIRVKEIEAGRGDIRPNMLLVMDPRGETITLPGEQTTEPTFGLPAMWISEGNREEALFRGYTVVDPPTVITTHLTEVVKENMADLLSYAETQKLLGEVGKDYQKLVADVVPTVISVGGMQRILQNLLNERVSIRDLPTVLEAVSEASAYTRNIGLITEHVRTRLSRQISEANTTESGFIPLLTLSPEWEQAFAESLVGDGEDRQLSMQPSRLQQFITGTRQAFDRYAQMGEAPVLLTSPMIRPYVRSIVERFRPNTVVMSQNEIHPKAKIKTLGQI